MGTLAVSGSLERAMGSRYPERAGWNAGPGGAILMPIKDVSPYPSAVPARRASHDYQAKVVRRAIAYEVMTKSEWC